MQSSRPLRVIVSALGCCAILLTTLPSLAGDNSSLLKQSHSIQIAASDLLTELYQAEHSILFPQNDRVTIMFSQIQGARIFLYSAELYINDELIETYQYKMYMVELLAHLRAVQPLFTTLLPAGEHSIRVRIYGQALGGNRFVEAEKVIQKSDSPLFLQLDNGFREITVSQWQ